MRVRTKITVIFDGNIEDMSLSELTESEKYLCHNIIDEVRKRKHVDPKVSVITMIISTTYNEATASEYKG